jgi:hypothetical protein
MRLIPSIRLAWSVVAIASCATLVFTSQAQAGPFALFGEATQVIGGLGPDNKAVELTSRCPRFIGQPPNIICDAIWTVSGIAYTPPPHMTVKDITALSTSFNVGASDCINGGPYFEIDTPSGNIYVVIGPPPDFTNCFYGWQTTGNVVASSDARVSSLQLGGPFFGTWADALAVGGDNPVTAVMLITDQGWNIVRGQAITVDNFRVNNALMNGDNVK